MPYSTQQVSYFYFLFIDGITRHRCLVWHYKHQVSTLPNSNLTPSCRELRKLDTDINEECLYGILKKYSQYKR